MSQLMIGTMKREDWLAARKTCITATDISAILGINRYRSPLAVYLEKTGQKESDEMTEAMQRGIDLEPYVAAVCARETGRTLRQADFLKHPRCEYFGATPDFYDADDDQTLIEIKTAGFWAGKDFGEKGTDQLPDQYLAQCQWQLAVTGKSKFILAVLIAGQDFRLYNGERDDDLIRTMEFHAHKFWNEYVLADNPPPLSDHDWDAKWVSGKHPQDVGEMISADEETEEWCGRLKESLADLAVCESKVQLCKTNIQAFMGDAGAMETDMGRFTWRKAKGSVSWKNVAAGLLSQLSIEDRQVLISINTGEGSRRFVTPFGKEE